MDGKSPGIWIGAAIAVAVLVVALSVPKRTPEEVVPASQGEATRESPASRTDIPKIDAPPPLIASPSETASAPPVPAAPVPRTSPSAETAPQSPPATTPPAPAPSADVEPPPAVSRSAAIQALDNVQFALRDFRVALGGNPVGTNEEITSALLGNNDRQVRMDVPDGSRLSEAGELLDPWGTPYFFHQVSAQKMEVRSAGPDRKMWTYDDVQM